MLSAQDEAFVQLATRRGVLTPRQLQAANDLRADVGLDAPVAQLLLEGKVLGPAVVASILRDLTRGHFACERCGERAAYDALGRLPRLACARCGGALTFVEPATVDGEPRPTGAHAAAGVRATGRHAVRPTGTYPATGAYPAAGPYPGTGAYPAVGQPGRHPTTEGVRATGAYAAIEPPPPTTRRHPAVAPEPPAVAPPAVPPPDAWDVEATVIDRSRRGAGPPRAEPADTIRGAPAPTGRGESTIRDARVLGLPGRDRTIGPYVLIKELGRGAGGVIYLARRPGLERRFAVKLLLGDMAIDEQAVERFKLEAAVASKVDDPGIVAVYDTGCADGRYYYAMEYCPGPTLEERLKQGRMGFDEAARTVLALARTMQAAHDVAVIHRDLKPSNVILEEGTGRPKVTDFGVARDTSRDAGLSRTGELLGTPAYMAPEQIVGARDIDHRVDIYALGVILFECVAGRRPHEAPTAVMLAEKVVHEDAPLLTSVRPDAPPALAEICRLALARDRAERYESARALAADLERFLGAPGAPRRRRRSPARGRWALRALVAAAGVAAALGAVGGVRLWRARQDALAEQERRAQEAAAAARALELTNRRRALVLDLVERRRSLDELRDDAKRLAAEPGGPPSLVSLSRAFEAIALARRPADEPVDVVLAGIDEAIAAVRDDATLSSELHLEAAALLLRRLRVQPALERIERALAEPGRTGLEARLLRAEAFDRLGRSAERLAALEELAREDPEGTVGLVARSMLWLGERPEEASNLVRRALEREPIHWVARLQLVACLLRQRREQEAQREVQRQLELLPDLAQAHLYRARILAGSDRGKRDALAALDRAVSLSEPDPDPTLLRERAKLRADLDDPAAAIGDLDRAISARPDSAAMLLERAELHERLGQPAAAEADWKRANALDAAAVARYLREEATPELRRRVESVLLGPGPPGPRVPEPARVGRADDFSRELDLHLVGRAALALEAARPALVEALRRAARGVPWAYVDEALAGAISVAPDDPVVALETARLAVGRDVYQRAAGALARARELRVRGLELDRLEADLARRRGALSEARRRFEALAERDRMGAEGLFARAQVEALAGRVPAAMEAVDAALARDPEHPGAIALKVELLLSLERPDLDGAQQVIARGMRCVAGTDSRFMLARFRCLSTLTARDLGTRGMQLDVIERSVASLLEVGALFQMSEGAGVAIALADAFLDLELGPARRVAADMLQAAREREPERAELFLVLGRFELLGWRPAAAGVLDAWRRARLAEPALRIPPRYVAEFRRRFGDRPELQALLSE